MNLKQTESHVLFLEGGLEAGLLVLNDRFKPFLHPVRTPAGHVVSDAMPCDHRHHKGLMYALRCADLHFWEEGDSPDIGIQKVCNIRIVGGCVELDLLWLSCVGGMETYRETRTISCRHEPARHAFVWNWISQRKALRDHRLIKSEWSAKLPDGRTINYHGLGIRVPRSWAFDTPPHAGGLLGGQPVPGDEAMGSSEPDVGLYGRMDGFWETPSASVTIRQNHGFTAFALRGGLAYLSVGPSNLSELDIPAGAETTEHYEIEIADRITPNNPSSTTTP